MTPVIFTSATEGFQLDRLLEAVRFVAAQLRQAVPTGIVTAEMAAMRRAAPEPSTRTCHECLTEGQTPEARYCLHCGARLQP